jgi:hypothetical protein
MAAGDKWGGIFHPEARGTRGIEVLTPRINDELFKFIEESSRSTKSPSKLIETETGVKTEIVLASIGERIRVYAAEQAVVREFLPTEVFRVRNFRVVRNGGKSAVRQIS